MCHEDESEVIFFTHAVAGTFRERGRRRKEEEIEKKKPDALGILVFAASGLFGMVIINGSSRCRLCQCQDNVDEGLEWESRRSKAEILS